MLNIYLKSKTYPQPVTLSDGSAGYVNVTHQFDHVHYEFDFVDHFDHNFWLSQRPHDGLTVNVSSIDGPEHYRLVYDC